MSAAAAPAIRWAVLVLGFATSVVAASAWYRSRDPGASTSVRIVDNEAELTALLERRARAPATAPRPATTAAAAPFARANGLVREPIDEEVATTFFPALDDPRNVFDPLVWFARRPGSRASFSFAEHPAGEWVIRINAHGFRDVAPVRAARPALRVLVAGDSQLEGVCANDETISERIEYRLQRRRPAGGVEVLNGAIGSHTPYNYLGTLERYLDLAPHVFLVFVFGGNDFKGMMPIRRYLHREPPPRGEPYRPSRLAGASDELEGLEYAELGQLYYFLNNPEDRAAAVETLDRITRTIRDLCRDRGLRLLCVYVPPPLSGNPAGYRDHRDRVLEVAGLTEDDLCITDALADGWLWRAEAAGVDVLDLRPVFARCEERLFWGDAHLNLRGNELVASRVANALEVVLKTDR